MRKAGQSRGRYNMTRIAIIFRRLGPYHHARLRASGRVMEEGKTGFVGPHAMRKRWWQPFSVSRVILGWRGKWPPTVVKLSRRIQLSYSRRLVSLIKPRMTSADRMELV
jgi:hypothetical protein